MEHNQYSSTQTRTQRRALRMREAILDTAQGILAREGAAKITCEMVADAADVSMQTVYNRVGRKDDLLMALAERALEQNHHYMDAAYALEGSAIERIEAALEAYVRFAFEARDAFLSLAVPPQGVASDRLAELLRLQNGRFAKVIAAGQAEGVIDSSHDPATCATTLWAMWNGLLITHLHRAQFGLEKAEMDTVLAAARQIIEHGLRSKS